ncbi:sensor histidine kinase [Microbispora sp. H11081]|uniref:sensor histidine kinase n=1 Tax=Microbispora sp. H11081 TaxID=2729107 RepID=UPI001475EEAF|nr:histidine kinase [Microbispora sp. H11081]
MDSSDAPGHRRSRRDRLVDTAIFALAVVFVLYTSVERLNTAPLPPAWLFTTDQLVSMLGCAALWLRRRWPVGIAVTLVALSCVFELIAGAMLAAQFSVAIHRRPRVSGAVFGLSVLAAIVFVCLRPDPDMPPLALLTLGLSLQATALGWGLLVQHRRRLVLARAEQARHQVREAIARDIHDVLGHRLSLLSVHAGALEFNPGADPADVARAARVIRESAHQALQDLREVIGVLRAPTGGPAAPTAPDTAPDIAPNVVPGPPSLADLERLVAESGQAGMRLELRDELRARETVPDRTGRTAYRVVQEALTNARKHAPGAGVLLRLTGAPGEGLTVEVVDDAPAAAGHGGGSGGGHGLTGLAERVTLAGGRLEHGRLDGGRGGWRVRAWLPWPA